MIKAIVLNLSLQDFCLREIERTLGLPISQLIKILKEISDSYSGGMDIFEIEDDAEYCKKACMEAGNKLFMDIYQREYKRCVSKGYPDGLASIFTCGYMHGILSAFARGHSEYRRIGYSITGGVWVSNYAIGYTLSTIEMKEKLKQCNQPYIEIPTFLGITNQEYEGIQDITIGELRDKYGISDKVDSD